LVHEVARAWKRNPLSDLDKILQDDIPDVITDVILVTIG